KIVKAKATYLEAGEGSADERLETVVGRLFDPEARKAFYESYKENLAKLYAAVRNGYAPQGGFVADLAYKTRRLVEEEGSQEGLGILTKTVTFDVKTLEGLRREPGSDETKVFNLVRSLHHELEEEPAAAPVRRPIAERAERILQELENRNTTGL